MLVKHKCLSDVDCIVTMDLCFLYLLLVTVSTFFGSNHSYAYLSIRKIMNLAYALAAFIYVPIEEMV